MEEKRGEDFLPSARFPGNLQITDYTKHHMNRVSSEKFKYRPVYTRDVV